MSTLKVNTLQTAAGVEVYTCKAWVNFDGTGTVAIRASGNVTSITDNGTGNYTVNFTNALTDANYCVTAMCAATNNAGGPRIMSYGPTNTFSIIQSTTQVRLVTENTDNGTEGDSAYCNVAIFR